MTAVVTPATPRTSAALTELDGAGLAAEAETLVERARPAHLRPARLRGRSRARHKIKQTAEGRPANGRGEAAAAVIRMRTDGLELTDGVTIVVPAEHVGSKGSARRLDHAVQIGSIGPSAHDVAIALLRHPRRRPNRAVHLHPPLKILRATHRPQGKPSVRPRLTRGGRGPAGSRGTRPQARSWCTPFRSSTPIHSSSSSMANVDRRSPPCASRSNQSRTSSCSPPPRCARCTW